MERLFTLSLRYRFFTVVAMSFVIAIGLGQGIEDLLQGAGGTGEFVAQGMHVLGALVAVVAEQIAQGGAAFEHGGYIAGGDVVGQSPQIPAVIGRELAVQLDGVAGAVFNGMEVTIEQPLTDLMNPVQFGQ